MKRIALCLSLFLLLALIVLPVVASVNLSSNNPALHAAPLCADGSPGPPLPPSPPKTVAAPVLVADGSPGPPLPPSPKIARAMA